MSAQALSDSSALLTNLAWQRFVDGLFLLRLGLVLHHDLAQEFDGVGLGFLCSRLVIDEIVVTFRLGTVELEITEEVLDVGLFARLDSKLHLLLEVFSTFANGVLFLLLTLGLKLLLEYDLSLPLLCRSLDCSFILLEFLCSFGLQHSNCRSELDGLVP